LGLVCTGESAVACAHADVVSMPTATTAVEAPRSFAALRARKEVQISAFMSAPSPIPISFGFVDAGLPMSLAKASFIPVFRLGKHVR
jgi:hypothetical protein